MSDAMIETRGLTRRFKSKTALDSLDLTIGRGGTHAIVGSNGAGKSTLFRILLGVITPSAGEAYLLGERSTELSPETRGKVGYVNEEHTLPEWMTTSEVTQFQKSFYPQWEEEIYHRVLSHFEVGADQRVSNLSRGERAGLNLSLALAQAPQLLILDEPTLGMDVVAKKAFLESLMFVGADLETTIVYCSHQMEEVARLADELLIFEKGQLKHQSTPDDFCERVNYWIATFPGEVALEELPGLLNQKEIEGQFHLTTLDQGEDFGDRLRALGADAVQACPVNLETAVDAFLAKNHAAPKHHS